MMANHLVDRQSSYRLAGLVRKSRSFHPLGGTVHIILLFLLYCTDMWGDKQDCMIIKMKCTEGLLLENINHDVSVSTPR